jgi:hypothetical protein
MGRDYSGELGDGTIGQGDTFPEPVLMATGEPMMNVKAVGAGFDSTCAVVGDGDTFCWGVADSHQLGNAIPPDTCQPVLPYPCASHPVFVGRF